MRCFLGLLRHVPTLTSVHPLLHTLSHLETFAQDGIFLLFPIAWLTLAGLPYLRLGSLFKGSFPWPLPPAQG